MTTGQMVQNAFCGRNCPKMICSITIDLVSILMGTRGTWPRVTGSRAQIQQ